MSNVSCLGMRILCVLVYLTLPDNLTVLVAHLCSQVLFNVVIRGRVIQVWSKLVPHNSHLYLILRYSLLTLLVYGRRAWGGLAIVCVSLGIEENKDTSMLQPRFGARVNDKEPQVIFAGPLPSNSPASVQLPPPIPWSPISRMTPAKRR